MTDHPAPNDLPLPGLSVSRVADLGQLGEYRLVQKLGQGGMGVVYKAVHTELDRVVAVKVLPAGRLDDEDSIARFQREIRAIGRLDHPHIVRAYDARRIGATHFLVMEFVDGPDWEHLVGRHGPLRVADACELVRQAALGLQHAHEHGLVHRDIKPSNLMLTSHGQVKILDLGLARILGSTTSQALTISGQMMGTPDYLAPEQANDSHAVDIRADLYSLGCTLYKLLAGRAPFEDPTHATLSAKLRAHERETPPPIGGYRRDLPSGLVAILSRLLAKDPAQRWATPGELAAALVPWAADSQLAALAVSGETQTVKASLGPTVVQPERPAGQRWLWLAGLLVALAALGVAGRGVGRALLARRERAEPATLAARPSPAPTTGPACSPASRLPGWIVLSWTPVPAGKPSLWLFRPDGSRRIRLTEDPAWFDIQPAFSPDGRRLAFVRTRPLGAGSAIWICAADGTRARQLVAAESADERIVSPVWLSDSQLAYVRDPKIDRQPDMELWQADADTGATERVLALRDLLSGRGAMLTDASPDSGQLLVAAQRGIFWATADVFLLDRRQRTIRPLWQDPADDHKDARPRWSPHGGLIAWHHNFTAGSQAKTIYYGVALARRGADDRWNVEFQPDEQAFVTPLAWSPDGERLLCARRDAGEAKRQQLVLMDTRFRVTDQLFVLEAPGWHPEDRDSGNMADWAIVPDDVPLPSDDER